MDRLKGGTVCCSICNNKFTTNFSRNRHMEAVHNIIQKKRVCVSRIICPICKDHKPLKTYDNLEVHLQEKHGVKMEKMYLKFVNNQAYAKWRETEKIEVNYAIRTKTATEIYYACNRSDLEGYRKNYKVRREKASGSIKMYGVCPSRYVITFYKNGKIFASIQRTHVGHAEEIRTQHLSMEEKNTIVQKLKAGVSTNRILEDARKTTNTQLSRINLLNEKDVNNLCTKYNIDKKRRMDGMVDERRKLECDNLVKFLLNLDENNYKIAMGKFEEIKKEIEAKNQPKIQ